MRFTSWVFLISLKRTWEHSSHSLWLDSGTSSGCSQMSRFLQQDDLIRFNPVILVIRFSCLIPSSLQVQCLVRDTTTRGILVKGVDRRTENRGGRVLFSSAFGCNGYLIPQVRTTQFWSPLVQASFQVPQRSLKEFFGRGCRFLHLFLRGGIVPSTRCQTR